MLVDSSFFKSTDSNAFFFGATQLLCIDGSAGLIGVGTSNPAYKLDVAGDVNVSSLLIGGSDFVNQVTYSKLGPVGLAQLSNNVSLATLPGVLHQSAFSSNSIPYSAISGGDSPDFQNMVIAAMSNVTPTASPIYNSMSNVLVEALTWTSLSQTVNYTNLGPISLAALSNEVTLQSLPGYGTLSNLMNTIDLSKLPGQLPLASLSNNVTLATLSGQLLPSAFSNASIPLSAIADVTSETFSMYVAESMSNIDITATLSNAIVHIGQELVSNTTYVGLGSVPWPQLTNVTYSNMGFVPTSSFSNASIPQAALMDPSWSTSASNVFLMNSNVGIGTNNPQYVLHVLGSDIVNNPTSIFTNGDIVAYSDARLKSDVRVIEDAMAKINKISGYTYVRNDGGVMGTKRMAGVLAQEIQAVLPEVVYEDAQSHYYSVAYGNVSALLIEAIKELGARLEKVESRI